MPTLGNRIRRTREALNLTQAEFATAIGVKQLQVSRYELGNAEPKLATLTRIADYANVSIDWLCGREDRQNGMSAEAQEAALLVNALASREDQRVIVRMIQLMSGELRFRASRDDQA